ncbi:tyrosine-type recombinase/integrase [Streptacidiphilus anmyonensis]|uniref:tyrosine-type recombinase/integrase n=1 Tax=Streptacidiphilus anmyonensis TaxID=405782 RepID=UPI000B17E4C8|nr:site-specific integrase [Streptacidiphilus anmyonensis]
MPSLKVIAMRAHESMGRVYRRCGCRDAQHHQPGSNCPTLAIDPTHGTWTFAVDLPALEPGGHNRTVRRGGFPSEDEARTALHRYLAGRRIGINADPNQTVADYLTQWLAGKRLTLKPTTWVRYRDYTVDDLTPALGAVRLDDLAYEHIQHFVQTQLAAGRGRPTVWHILATLSSALGEAVRTHRLPANVARPTVIPRPAAAERTIWPPAQAVKFLRYCRIHDVDFADLIELIIGTGLRKGEALALHWDDIHLARRLLYVRWTLSAIDNNKLILTAPKTSQSRDWVALSPQVRNMLTRRKDAEADGGVRGGFVFHRDDGGPLHPEYVLNHFHDLARKAGVPKCSVHDLRHLAVTTALAEGVDLEIVSKTARHSTLSVTANIYAHLTRRAAHQAVDAIDKALAREEARHDHATSTSPPKPRRRISRSGYGKAV